MSPDTPHRYVSIAGRRFRVPASRRVRLVAGGLLLVGGVLGFLPVLGFWMIPLGLVVLSVDSPAIRRIRRRLEVWGGRKLNSIRGTGPDRGNGSSA
jgi:hypothetical protein